MLTLVIGNKNYSSWSLRPWLLLRHFDIPFNERLESLANPMLNERLAAYSPSQKVPVLIDKTLTIWDSMAICEYICETYLANRGWPQQKERRAQARSVCAEMHAGFTHIRHQLPMNCRAQKNAHISHQLQREIDRIEDIWTNREIDEPWLFGEFGIADCFFAPVAMRFFSYNIPLTARAQQYCDSLLAHPQMVAWTEAAREEKDTIIAVDEVFA